MALVEVSVAMVVFAVATSILAQTFHAGHGLRRQAREEFMAMAAAQSTLESMRGIRFDRLVESFDEDVFNDPAGPGTAPGASFDIEGLDPVPTDPDGRVGEIVLPSVNLGSLVAPRYELREDQGDPRLGMPRDLNGDARVDSLDHSADKVIVPVLITVRWQSASGERQLDFYSALAEITE